MKSKSRAQSPNEKGPSNSKTSSRSNYRAPSHGIFAVLPKSWIPYAELMRLDRPAGFFAFYWHYLIGLSYAAAAAACELIPCSLALAAIYLAIWVVILRGAVCTVNDNLDQEFDRKVIRTRFRPIARGAVSTTQASVFALMQYALLALILLYNPFPHSRDSAGVYMYAGLSVAILTLYPLAKRVTDFPQVILGVGFAAAIPFSSTILGLNPLYQNYPRFYSSLVDYYYLNHFEPVISLCLASTIWTVVFDTVYAHQDRQDDISAGVRSLAVRLDGYTKPALLALTIVQVALLAITGIRNQFSLFYFVFTCGGVTLIQLIMLFRVDLETPESCAWWFGEGTAFVGVSMVVGFLGEYANVLENANRLIQGQL